MVNHFRAQMTRPIIGIGHSMGGFHLTQLALLHPRLFTTLILIDPVIQRVPNPSGNYAPAKASAKRRDIWPNRAAARTAFQKSKFYQAWDPRVLELWLQHGLRDLPTALHPTSSTSSSSDDPQVTLTTSKHQEVLTFMRGNFPTASNPNPSTAPNPLTHPDVDLSHNSSPFYRPEPIQLFSRLPSLRPSVLYIFGTHSNLSAPDLQADKLAVTGSGLGGSGGVKEGRVKGVELDAGHLIPMEKVEESADHVGKWIGKEMVRYRDWEKKTQEEWGDKKGIERSVLSERFMEELNGLMARSKPKL